MTERKIKKAKKLARYLSLDRYRLSIFCNKTFKLKYNTVAFATFFIIMQIGYKHLQFIPLEA